MLWDDPPHVCSVWSLTTTRDDGGGVTNTYALSQSNIPCLINTASASEVERFAQMNIVVTHTIGFLGTAVTLARGYKITDSDGNSYHVHGIRTGRSFIAIPGLTYAECEQVL